MDGTSYESYLWSGGVTNFTTGSSRSALQLADLFTFLQLRPPPVVMSVEES